MYPILGKSVIEHTIENLKAGGIHKIFMIVGHQKGALMDYVGNGSFFDTNVAYIYQLEKKGIAHAIYQAKDWISTTFVTLLGDSFIEPKEEINELIKLHRKEKPIATVLVFKVESTKGYGIVKFKSLDNGHGEIETMIEKPGPEVAEKYRSNGQYYAIVGLYIFEPKIFDYINKTKPGIRGEIQITDAMELALNSGEKIFGAVLKGKYLDIGKWETVFDVEKFMMKDFKAEKHIEERENMAKKVESFS
jgi:dTDP-glucose pyrophosphorylase